MASRDFNNSAGCSTPQRVQWLESKHEAPTKSTPELLRARSGRNKEHLTTFRALCVCAGIRLFLGSCFLIARGWPRKWSKNEHLWRACCRKNRSHKSVINSKAQKQRKRESSGRQNCTTSSRGGVLSFYLNQWSVFAVSKTYSFTLYSGRGGLRPVDLPLLNCSAQIECFFYAWIASRAACRDIHFSELGLMKFVRLQMEGNHITSDY